MRFFISSFVGLVLLLSAGCSSTPEPLFVMNLEADFKMQAGLNNLDTHYFILRGVPTFSANYVNSPEARDAVGEILANRAEINARFSDIDWSIVQEVSIWAQSASDASLKKEIFYQDRINFGNVQELQLFSSLSEVKDILLQEAVTLEVRIKLKQRETVHGSI